MKRLEDYQITNGTIFHLDDDLNPEFGDGLARYSSWNLCEYVCATGAFDKSFIKSRFSSTVKQFILEDGEPIRHPAPGWWRSRGTASGDQIEAYLCACLAMGMHKEVLSMCWKIIKRYGFAWNTKHIGQHDDKSKTPDFVLLRILGILLRSLCSVSVFLYILYPIIALWDLLALPLSTLVRCVQPLRDRDDTGDDLNYFHKHLAYSMCLPTPISWFCRNFYYAFRPLSGSPEYRATIKGSLGCISAFRCYYAGPKNPPLDIYLTNAALII